MATEEGLYSQVVMILQRDLDDKKEKENTKMNVEIENISSKK